MARCIFTDGRKNINLSLQIRFVEILVTGQLAAKVELSLLSMKNF